MSGLAITYCVAFGAMLFSALSALALMTTVDHLLDAPDAGAPPQPVAMV